ncbi:MAG: photosynthesis system II assembly factor Ycf48 [Symploca sp. SIO1C4]|uniref:Photosystem II assembly protein Ycf48 n=1 Tax=Symploca sp. SIO1C4 TaxID=2607765 RepID=A0A6B3NP63_9CYAN|nr:photosynthesis system II assembly factor Ycf48 [Symploca sp. SIO1C4]NET07342.1 photosynthesis system II assembly factor Ycf48 [Symploca sp. SIO2B6]
MNCLMRRLKQIVILLAVTLFCASCSYVDSIDYNPWQIINLPTDSTLRDIGFTSDASHGWAVGSKSTILETTDGGNNWQEKKLELGDLSYRFTSVNFAGEEGWIAGAPSILLHTTDGGTSWSRIPLSEKLPGSPNTIVALGPQAAEMTTTVGAIYQTENAGQSWKAMVEQAVGVVRNISRSDDGKYVAVSARGNFYSTWEPGESAWLQHNRNSSKRLQNMGFTEDGRLWTLARGGLVQFSTPEDVEVWEEPIYPEQSTSWGLLDLAYRTPEELWVAGGSANLFCSFDGGKTWQKDREVENVPSNLYKIVFLTPEQGFIIGQRGVLLKYEQSTQPA